MLRDLDETEKELSREIHAEVYERVRARFTSWDVLNDDIRYKTLLYDRHSTVIITSWFTIFFDTDDYITHKTYHIKVEIDDIQMNFNDKDKGRAIESLLRELPKNIAFIKLDRFRELERKYDELRELVSTLLYAPGSAEYEKAKAAFDSRQN